MGMEESPGEWCAQLVKVFGEVRRVLADDGTLWLNIGDAYAGSWGAQGRDLKPKDLIGLPWLLAFALRADRWHLRADIIWSKPNPMPESVQDRPTRAHEYVFLLSKQARYYYDADSLRTAGHSGLKGGEHNRHVLGEAIPERERRAPRVDKQRGHDRRHAGFNDRWDGMTRSEQQAKGANARSVWAIATQPYPAAHFATFPEELARRCILAGSAPGDCVLDSFGGSGTVAAMATGHGRSSIYIDLNPDYVELARQRIGPALCLEGAA